MDADQRAEQGRKIVAAREARGWSQEALVEESGVSKMTVLKMERGGVVQPAKLRAVLDILGLQPLAAAQAESGYSVDVQLVRDAIGMWLRDMPEQERAAKVRLLIECILTSSTSTQTGQSTNTDT